MREEEGIRRRKKKEEGEGSRRRMKEEIRLLGRPKSTMDNMDEHESSSIGLEGVGIVIHGSSGGFPLIVWDQNSSSIDLY